MNTELPSPELLRKLLRYEPETGKLFWEKRNVGMFYALTEKIAVRNCATWNAKFYGKEALCAITDKGYMRGRLLGVLFMAHRVVWAINELEWPMDEIDHKDGNRSNNVILNLRPANRAQNCANVKSLSGSSSIYLGVYKSSSGTRWCASIRSGSIRKHLGSYNTEKEAAIAYDAAAKIYHGDFANVNF